jgi:hypothetical protein
LKVPNFLCRKQLKKFEIFDFGGYLPAVLIENLGQIGLFGICGEQLSVCGAHGLQAHATEVAMRTWGVLLE